MDNLKFNTLTQNKARRQNLSQNRSWQPVACRDFQEMLELLTNTDDLDLLVKIFSTLGINLLTKNITYEWVIKSNTLYKKLALVLKSGLQTKSIIALKFISALLYLDNENKLMEMKSLHIFAKNMIRVSGCLTAMTELFTSFMMQQDTWKALCRSISETCDGSAPNQAYCSHLVPLCIQKCKRGNMDPISILQSLLSNHQGNVKLFYESKGITMFDRDSLQNPACLQLLNLVVENTKPEYCDEILKASNLFHQLRSNLNKYGRNSVIGQWTSVILFSYSKVIQTEIVNEEEFKENNFKPKINKTLHKFSNETHRDVNDTFNETEELLKNVLREAIGWQNQFGNKNKFKHNIFNLNNTNNNIKKKSAVMPYSQANTHKPNRNEKDEYEENNIFRFAVETETKIDLSFSFLLKDSPLEPKFKKSNHSVWSGEHDAEEVQTSYKEPSLLNSYKAYEKFTIGRKDSPLEPRFKKSNHTVWSGEQHAEEVQTSYKEPILLNSYKAYEKSTRGRNDETVIEFKPTYVSTPKGSKHSKEKPTFRTRRKSLICSTSRDNNIFNKTINNRSKFTTTMMTNKGLRNTSMSAKFLDIVNGSCTALITGFKSMFTTKKPSDDSLDKLKDPVTTNVAEFPNSYGSSSTNYIHSRDVTVSKENRDQDWTNFTNGFSMENSYLNSCNTCNDTIVLKHKLENDIFLQKTVKRLKLGINLYGCNFKKISRTMWPREMYMTPNVLYNLYRKLIIRQ